MGEVVIESNNIIFYNTDPEDIDKIMEIESKEENRKFIYSWSKKRHLKAIDDLDEMHITIRDKSRNKTIGYILLSGLDGEDQSIELRRIAIEEKGRGFGKASMNLVKKLCFERLKCHRLWLDLYADNLVAKNLYLSEGFIKEGLLRECKKSNNGFRSMIIMSMLEREYNEKDANKFLEAPE